MKPSMESSASETPIREEQNPSTDDEFDHHEAFVFQNFRCLGLEESHNRTSFDQHFPAKASPESSVSSQPRNPVSDYGNLWGPWSFSQGLGETFGTRTPVSQPRSQDSFHHHCRCHRFNGEITCYAATNNVHWWNNPLTDQSRVLQILKGEQFAHKRRLIYALQRYFIALMTDYRMCSIFEAFLVACEEVSQLDLLVETILLDQESFLNAAFCKQGAVSMTKIIRKVKRSPHASTVAAILLTRFLDLMTDFTARKVIETCFVLFRPKTNEIFYEVAIRHCHYLARHKVGCRLLNSCISTIACEQRSRLLDKISDIADVLCDDHYGNYVLQYVMDVNYGNVNAKIFDCLQGKFVQFAQRQISSHIVEKCMEISVHCLMSVVMEILNSPRGLQALADHTFGNYVVQKALKMTKSHGLTDLYNALVNSLRPRFTTLMKTPFGRSVVNVIKELALQG